MVFNVPVNLFFTDIETVGSEMLGGGWNNKRKTLTS